MKGPTETFGPIIALVGLPDLHTCDSFRAIRSVYVIAALRTEFTVLTPSVRLGAPPLTLAG
jgi:hypothetical protein